VLTFIQDDTQEDKLKKYIIFKKIRDAKDEVELSLQELTLIKKCIGRINPPLIMGQAFEMLDGK
jgi:hypothetical protein